MNKRDKQCDILSLLKMNKVGIGALLENKLKKDKVDDMMAKLFLGWDYYCSNVTEGRILVIWQKSFIKVQVLMEHQQIVHYLVKLTGMHMVFLVTFVYGLNTIDEILEMWKGLSYTPLPVKPWLIVGDFNAVFNFDDKAGGKTISDAELLDSAAWLAQIQMAALKSIGSKYTWSNKQDEGDRVYSKIDHAFTNEDWVDELPNTIAEFQWDVTSDHCYCLIKSHKHGNLGTKPLRFFNLWIAHRGFKDVVKGNWNKPMAVRGLQGMIKKLLRLKHALRAFNRDEIGDVEQGYHQAKEAFLFNVAKGFMGSTSSATSPINSQCIDFGPCLDIEMQLRLIRKFSKADVKKALFSIPGTKIPGPDGYGSKFYKAMWQDIGDEISEAILEFFNTGKIPAELNETVLALVPKIYMPSSAVDYRPINYNRKNTSPRCALKIDLSKAYDTVNWCFLERLLVCLRFPTRFIHWVMVCLRSTSYVLMMNGRLQGGFQGVKGLRQGDPISPLLFVLIMEYLTQLLQLGAQQHDFRFHPLCKSLKIINLCFADGLIIFYKANRGSGQCVKKIFDDFCSSTGLKANLSKSQVYFGGVLNANKVNLLQVLQFEEGTFPFKYLGVPMRPKKWKAADCGVILRKIKLRLHTWASRHLSYAGRSQLIPSVLLGLRNYWMNIFLLPQSIVKEVDRLCMWFMWGNNGTRSNFHLTSGPKFSCQKLLGVWVLVKELSGTRLCTRSKLGLAAIGLYGSEIGPVGLKI
ncbi:uncharacterized protein LOC133778804 [Humulus lupulus]|uniref:uncharacterized protein LOC133778804 n=1 Tax=Humulus lupulus TaxID=3486 RepID=UPI002B404596|nr:uncharacterized protein LOC133778804 [Humulus lupulus]